MTTKNKKGFSLIDLLVSISIATLVMSVVLFGYRTFQNKLAVSAAAQEIAVSARTAQTSSSEVKQSSTGSGDFSSGYGVYFSMANPDSYYVFVDTNHDGKYSGDANCSAGTECVRKEPLKNNVNISTLCGVDTSGTQDCPPTGATGVSIVYPASNFQAPIADAVINFTDSSGNIVPGTYTTAKVVTGLTDLLTVNVQSEVSISQTGPIYVQPSIPSVLTTNHPPVLTMNGSNPMTVMLGATFTDPGATATDQEDGNLTSQIVATGNVNTLIAGTYTLTYNVTDSGGMPATSVTRTVNVTAAMTPVITTVSPGTLPLSGYVIQTVSGSNFTSSNMINLTGPGCPSTCRFSSDSSTPPNSLTFHTRGMTAGNYTLSITNGNGTSNSVSMNTGVVLTSITPTSATPGTSMAVIGAGIDLSDVLSITGSQSVQIPASSITFGVSGCDGSGGACGGMVNQMTFTLPSLPAGSYTISDTNDKGTSNSLSFTVPYVCSLKSVGSVKFSGLGAPEMIDIQGNYAYIVDTWGEFEIFDISNPSSPVRVGPITYINAGATYSIAVKGNDAYISGYTGSNIPLLWIYDISDPTNPTLKNSITISQLAHELVINGNYLYSTDEVDTFQIFDISNPDNPVLVGSQGTLGCVGYQYLSIQGNYAYMTQMCNVNGGDPDPALRVFDVSNLSKPTEIDTITTDQAPTGIATQGKYAYMLNSRAPEKMDIYDISNPSNLTLVGSASVNGGAENLVVKGNYAFVPVYFGGGISVYNISDPTNPVKSTQASMSSPYDIKIVGNDAYVTGSNSLNVFDVSSCQ